MITYDQFREVDLRVAQVVEAERIEGSDKLLRLQVLAGDFNEAQEPISRQIIAGIGKAYSPEDLIHKSIVIVANLQPRSLMGFESNGMLLAASDAIHEGPVLIAPRSEITPGAHIR